jgi:hypothetical protein
MLIWASLVVLVACALAWAIWPLSSVMIEVFALVLVGAVFLFICAVEARQ